METEQFSEKVNFANSAKFQNIVSAIGSSFNDLLNKLEQIERVRACKSSSTIRLYLQPHQANYKNKY
ncbi:MAG: hypothetical protein ACRC2R_02930 [Xenococcaceae cyanobacterium]